MSNAIWWRIYVFRQGENRTQLNNEIRKLHRNAPEVLVGHIATLNSRKRKVVVPGKSGYELTLTRGETKTIDGGMHYQIFVDFTNKSAPSILERRKWDALTVRELGLRDAPVPAADVDDYGLAEFDRISSSLAHSAPVAEAIRAIQREEVNLANSSAASGRYRR